MKRDLCGIAKRLLVVVLLPVLLAGCRSQSVRTVDRAGGIEVLSHTARLTGKYEFSWYTLSIDGSEVGVGEPWYDSEQRRFQRVELVRARQGAAVVKIRGASRESAYSHYMTFLVERDGQGGIEVTRLSPAGQPSADGLDILWPIPERRDP